MAEALGATPQVDVAAGRSVRPPETKIDPTTGGMWADYRGWDTEPEPDPEAESLQQYKTEKFKNCMPLEKVLHAWRGDPELGLEQKPPYVHVHPKGVVLGAAPDSATLTLHNQKGMSISGQTNHRWPAENHSWGGVCTFNPLVMTAISSTLVTPISTMLFSVKNSSLFTTAATAPPESISSNSMKTPATDTSQLKEAWETPHDVAATTETGNQLVVRGVSSLTEARAAALKLSRERNLGNTVCDLQDLGPNSV